MRAKPGDQLIIKGHHVGDRDRDGEILEVHGSSGEAPYVVRWSDNGHEGLIFPGSDAVIRHRSRRGIRQETTEPVESVTSLERRVTRRSTLDRGNDGFSVTKSEYANPAQFLVLHDRCNPGYLN